MKIDNIHEGVAGPPLRDDLADVRRHGAKRFTSFWTRIAGSASASFRHGLGEIPATVDVLESGSGGGASAASASSITVTKSATLVTVTNSGAARFFQVRAY